MRARWDGRGSKDISLPSGVMAPVLESSAESWRRCIIARSSARRGGEVKSGKEARSSTPCDLRMSTSWDRSQRKISGSVSAVRV